MFAGMAARYKWKDYKPSSLLKMSYYTAPKEVGLIPPRLMISLHEWSDDPELQELISRRNTLGSDPVAQFEIGSQYSL